jgi:uncharacterized membrane protein YsdA (DUF1294 family)
MATLVAGLAGWPLWAGILVWLLTLNLITLILFRYDKAIADSERTRVPESNLLGLSLIGGCFGAFLGMYSIAPRHKTQKQPFNTYFWIIASLHFTLLCGLVLWSLGIF